MPPTLGVPKCPNIHQPENIAASVAVVVLHRPVKSTLLVESAHGDTGRVSELFRVPLLAPRSLR